MDTSRWDLCDRCRAEVDRRLDLDAIGSLWTLTRIRVAVERRATEIGAPSRWLPTFGYSIDSGYPYVLVADDGSLHYMVTDCGRVLRDDSTTDIDELLYWIFATITNRMATDRSRHPSTVDDPDGRRRAMFRHQLELLGSLHPSWTARMRHEFGDLVDELGQ